MTAIFACVFCWNVLAAGGLSDEVTRELNGVWNVKEGNFAGSVMEASMIKTIKLTIKDNSFQSAVGLSSASGELVMDTSKKPMTMDIKIKEGANKGKTYKCIFKLENGELTVCYAFQGDRPSNFEPTEKNGWLLFTYQKAKGEKPKRR